MPRQLCKRCRKRSTTHDSGICTRCTNTYCVHCAKPSRALKRCLLCVTCYGKREVRKMYVEFVERDLNEPTWEQLEQIIAEQMQCLPDWWWGEFARVERELEEMKRGRL